jgi:hypothetical protein
MQIIKKHVQKLSDDKSIFKLQLNYVMSGCLDARDYRKVEDDLAIHG